MFEKMVNMLWSPYLLLLFMAVGLYCSLLTGFMQVSVKFWFRETLGQNGESGNKSSQFSSLCMALATTIGTGSIAGVASAIWYGGPGAMFWMWVSGFFGMMLSACERMLTLEYRVKVEDGYQGGPMYYLEQGAGSLFLARCFACACALSAFVGGNMVQGSAISQSLYHLGEIPTYLVGIVLMLLVSFTLRGGMLAVTKLSTVLVPFMAGTYLLAGLYCLFSDIPRLLEVVGDIFSSAFSVRSAVGGGGGYTVLMGMRYGMARGIFSNEAGLGAGSMAHGNAKVDHPARQGLWGMVEVFFATMVVCTLTGLVLLTSGIYQGDVAQMLTLQSETPLLPVGVPMTQQAFSVHLGEIGSYIVMISLILFAFTSILGWSCYGIQSMAYLVKKPILVTGYRCLLLLGLVFGTVMKDTHLLWIFLDFTLILMAVPNLIGLVLLAPGVCRSLREWAYG